MLRVLTNEETIDVHEVEAIITQAGEWIQYSSPNPEGQNTSQSAASPFHWMPRPQRR